MQDWWEVRVRCAERLEQPVVGRLASAGCRAYQRASRADGRVELRGFASPRLARPAALRRLRFDLRADASQRDLPTPRVRARRISAARLPRPADDGSRLPIGRRLLIHGGPLEIPPDAGRLAIRIDPCLAFGNGTHPSTRLALLALEARLDPVLRLGETTVHLASGPTALVADLGCGSGILGLAALALGVSRVVAVDIDPEAVAAARAQRQLNGVDPARLIIAVGSVEALVERVGEGADGLTANLVPAALTPLLPDLQRLVRPGGWLIVAGMLADSVPSIARGLARHGWRVPRTTTHHGWGCVLATRRDAPGARPIPQEPRTPRRPVRRHAEEERP